MTLSKAYNLLVNDLDINASYSNRNAFLNLLKQQITVKPNQLTESERGCDGGYYHNLEIWNPYEYAPWTHKEPLTLVIGDLTYIDDYYEDKMIGQNLTCVEILSSAKVLVTGNISVGRLFLLGGELQCLGTITTDHCLVTTATSHISANKIVTQNFGGFGTVNCNNINAQKFYTNEDQGLKIRLTNKEITSLTDTMLS